MKNPIQAIVDFNIKAGFLDKQNPKQFNDLGESSYLIEEALEPYNVDYIASLFKVDRTSVKYAKNPQREVAKAIVWLATDCPEYINGTCIDINNCSYPR